MSREATGAGGQIRACRCVLLRAERPLQRHARAVAGTRRSLRNLRHEVEISVLGAAIWLHLADFVRARARPAGRTRRRLPRRPASRRPRHATSVPPTASSGAAYSTTTSSGASARAVTRSNARSPSGQASTRAWTTRALATSQAAIARSRNAHFRDALSTSATLARGSAIASGRPGRPGTRAKIGDVLRRRGPRGARARPASPRGGRRSPSPGRGPRSVPADRRRARDGAAAAGARRRQVGQIARPGPLRRASTSRGSAPPGMVVSHRRPAAGVRVRARCTPRSGCTSRSNRSAA